METKILSGVENDHFNTVKQKDKFDNSLKNNKTLFIAS